MAFTHTKSGAGSEDFGTFVLAFHKSAFETFDSVSSNPSHSHKILVYVLQVRADLQHKMQITWRGAGHGHGLSPGLSARAETMCTTHPTGQRRVWACPSHGRIGGAQSFITFLKSICVHTNHFGAMILRSQTSCSSKSRTHAFAVARASCRTRQGAVGSSTRPTPSAEPAKTTKEQRPVTSGNHPDHQ